MVHRFGLFLQGGNSHTPQTITTRRHIFRAVLLIVVSANSVVNACSGHSENGHNHGDEEPGKLIVRDSHRHLENDTSEKYSWSTEALFQIPVRRCGTKEADSEEMEDMARAVEEWKRKTSINPRVQLLRVPVYIHLMINDQGDGNVADKQILDQIDVLTDAFGPLGIQFELEGIIVTVNNDWYRCELGRSEVDMKRTLRRGGAESKSIQSFQQMKSRNANSLSFQSLFQP